MKDELFCGIDVSKDKLDICFINSKTNKPSYQTLPNLKDVIIAYFKKFSKDNILVVFEPTSNYHINLQSALSELNIKYSLLNPAKSSLFLKHLSHIKTDVVDSYALAVYAKTFKQDIHPTKYNKEYNIIKSYNSATDLLIKMQTQLKNFIHSQKQLKNVELENILQILLKQIHTLKEKIKNLAYSLLKSFIPQTETILKASKGIGLDLALNLFPQLHFNKDKNEKQFISFLGLAHRVFISGSSIKKSQKINKKGSATIRKKLFLATLTCIRFNDKFKVRYEALISNGKNKKVAVVAVMCAIVRYLKSFFKFDYVLKPNL